MSQGIEKEPLVPGCFESFAAGGCFVGSHLEDICCEPAQEGQISRAVILSISGEVLMEYDVLLPMTSIFDVPMLSDDIEEVKRREPARGNEQSLLARGFAVDGALGHDPRDGGEALEPMLSSESRCGDDQDRSAFMPAMAMLGGLGRNRAAITMDGVGGDHTACQRQALQKRDRCFRLAALAGLGLSECHTHLCTPHRHHHRRHMGAALLVGALEALAIDRQNGRTGSGTKRPTKGGHEADERILKRRRVEALKHTRESVMARHPVLELQDGAKKSFLVLSELRHLDTGFSPAQHRRQRDEQYLAQVMPSIDVTRVRYRRKYDEEVAHPGVLQHNEDIRQNPCSTKAQVVFYSHAMPLGFTRLASPIMRDPGRPGGACKSGLPDLRRL